MIILSSLLIVGSKKVSAYKPLAILAYMTNLDMCIFCFIIILQFHSSLNCLLDLVMVACIRVFHFSVDVIWILRYLHALF